MEESNQSFEGSQVDVSDLINAQDINGLIAFISNGIGWNKVKVAIMALGDLNAKEAVPCLLDIVKKAELPSWRCAAAHVLGRLGGDEVRKTLRLVMLKDEYVRLEAVKALESNPDPENIEPLNLLLHDLHEATEIRMAVIDALGKILDAKAAEALLGVLNDGDPDIVDRACSAIVGLGDIAGEGLCHVLTSQDPKVCELPARLVGEIGYQGAVDPLMKILVDTDIPSEVRGEAADSLVKLGYKPAGTAFLEILANEPDYAIQCRVITAAGNLGLDEALDVLSNIVRDKSNPVRIRGLAAGALGNIGNPNAADIIVSLLKNHREDGWVMENAVVASGKLGCREAVPFVAAYTKESLQDGNIKYATEGFEALEGLGVFGVSVS